MTVRTIDSNSTIPPLRLPAGALSRYDRQHDLDPIEEQSPIEPIEHRIRATIIESPVPQNSKQLLGSYNHYNSGPEDPDPWDGIAGRKPTVVSNIEDVIQEQWGSEQTYFDHYDNQEVLADAPTYLQHVLGHCSTDSEAETERNKRERWYELMPWKNIYPMYKNDSLGEIFRQGSTHTGLDFSNSSAVKYTGVIVVDDSRSSRDAADEYGTSRKYVYRESSLDADNQVVPTDFGYEPPVPLLLAQYSNGSEYLLIPWSGGLVCQGPFKQKKDYRVACKHEVAAAITCQQNGGLELPVHDGVDVPARARRFVEPRIALEHDVPL